jgi:hypothetical protein
LLKIVNKDWDFGKGGSFKSILNGSQNWEGNMTFKCSWVGGLKGSHLECLGISNPKSLHLDLWNRKLTHGCVAMKIGTLAHMIT